MNSKRAGEVCIGLEQNIIDTAVNEWRKRLRVSVRTMGLHFEQFNCRPLKKIYNRMK